MSIWIDGKTSSAKDVQEAVIRTGASKLRFVVVEDIDKFKTRDLLVFLGLVRHGKIFRKQIPHEVRGFKVRLFATCKDFHLLNKKLDSLVKECHIMDTSRGVEA